MIWKKPHINKVYEAITAIADKRIVQEKDNPLKAKCYSSSGNKFYEIELQLKPLAMMSNDNSAYYTDTLSYPMIALLMLNSLIDYSDFLIENLKGVYWKDINQKYKNDYNKSVEHVLAGLSEIGADVNQIKKESQNIYNIVLNLEIQVLGEKIAPPKGY